MGRFAVRVELHNAIYADYNTLHSAMESAGFSRIIQDDDTKTWYHLPTAEYDYDDPNESSKEDVINKAVSAAKTTGKSHAIVVTKSNGRIWDGLIPVKRS